MRRLTRAPLFFAASLVFAAFGCTSADRRVAADVVSAAAPIACALAPLLDGGEVIAVLCEGAARVAAEALRASSPRIGEKGAGCVLVPLQRAGGDPRERVCERERERVLRAIGGAR